MQFEGLTGILCPTPLEVKFCGNKIYDENFETATKPFKRDPCESARTGR